MLKRKKSIRLRTGRTRRKGAEPIFIGPGLFGDYDGDGDAIAIVDIDGNPWPPRKHGVAEDSHDPGDEASGAGEDAVPNDGDDQAGAGAVRSPTGRLALRSSRKVDRLRSGSRKIDLDDENEVLRRIRDVGVRCREPERFYLAVLVFPKKADGWVRVVADHMVPTTNASSGTLRQRPPSSPGGRKIYLDDENDVLRRLRDVAARCREPKSFYLGVLVFPKGADGWVRVVADQMVPSTGRPRPRPPAPPVAQRGLKPPKRLGPRARNE